MTLVFLSMRMDISISLLRVLINGKLHQIIWINEDLLRGGQSIFSWCCDRHGRFVPRIGSRLSVIAFNLHKRRFATLRLKSGNRTSKLLVRLGLVRSRSEEHTSELQSLMRISYAVFCLKKKTHANSCRINNIAHSKSINTK